MKKGVILIVIAATFWGIAPTVSRLLYDAGSDPVSVAAMRAYIAGTIFLIYALFTGMFKKIKAKDIPFFAVYGLFAITGLYTIYLLAVDMISASIAAILLYTAPSFVIIFSRIIYKEPITKTKAISLIIALVGCGLVVKIYDISAVALNFQGIAMGLLSGICYSTLTLFGRKGLRDYSSTINSVMPMIFGALFMFFVRPIWQVPFSNVLITGYLSIGICAGVLGTLFYLTGIQLGVEGGDAMLIATIEPIVATAAGVLVLGDILEPLQLIGMMLVVLSASLPILKMKYDEKKSLQLLKEHNNSLHESGEQQNEPSSLDLENNINSCNEDIKNCKIS